MGIDIIYGDFRYSRRVEDYGSTGKHIFMADKVSEEETSKHGAGVNGQVSSNGISRKNR